MTDEQIDTMVKMHRYLMKCEIRHGFHKFCAENGNQDFSTANRSDAFNDTKWDEFTKWFKMIREE